MNNTFYFKDDMFCADINEEHFEGVTAEDVAEQVKNYIIENQNELY